MHVTLSLIAELNMVSLEEVGFRAPGLRVFECEDLQALGLEAFPKCVSQLNPMFFELQARFDHAKNMDIAGGMGNE